MLFLLQWLKKNCLNTLSCRSCSAETEILFQFISKSSSDFSTSLLKALGRHKKLPFTDMPVNRRPPSSFTDISKKYVFFRGGGRGSGSYKYKTFIFIFYFTFQSILHPLKRKTKQKKHTFSILNLRTGVTPPPFRTCPKMKVYSDAQTCTKHVQDHVK